MQVTTKLFGTIDIQEDKIITFENGIIGFPHCKQFTLIFEETGEGDHKSVSWLQSLDEPAFALPVIDPLLVKEDYGPEVKEEALGDLGTLVPENIYVLVTLTVPTQIEKMSVNLKAPIVINTDERKAVQIILEEDFPVKYPIYELLKARKEKGGE